MAWSDFETLFKATCKDNYETYKSFALNSANVIGTGEALIEAADVLGTEGHAIITSVVNSRRSALRGIYARMRDNMDVCLAYGGTQLTTPSTYVRGNRPTNTIELLRDIRAYMVANSLTVNDRVVTYASEPAAADNGILDRLTVDEGGSTIEAGLHNQTVDAVVTGKPSRYRSIITVRPRQKGIDIFTQAGPSGELLLEAVNDAYAGDGIVTNPNLNQGLSSNTNAADLSGDTSNAGWTLSKSGSVVHVWDTSIAYRGLTGSHKMYTNSTSRTWTQPLVVNTAHRRLPRNYMLAVYKTGTPVGNITVTWGNKTQVFTMGGLSAGWNYLRLDRDKDLYPINFDSGASTLAVEFAFTSGTDSSNYINFAGFFGQVYKNFDGPFYGHWSRNGVSTLFGAFTFADSMTATGLNQTALALTYQGTAIGPYAYLPSVGGGAETLADYT